MPLRPFAPFPPGFDRLFVPPPAEVEFLQRYTVSFSVFKSELQQHAGTNSLTFQRKRS
jgi:hypothetical protein